jgi:KDO2-lipid IV(A) lauroyltransferase
MKKIIDPAVFLLFMGFKTLFSVLPRTFCLALGRGMGLMFYFFDSKHRTIALSNLDLAFQKNNLRERQAIAKSSFLFYGEVIMDLIKFTTLSEKKRLQLVQIEGKEFIREALEQKRGVLLFTGHYGNWEIAPHSIARLGDLKVIARPLDNRCMEQELLRMRRSLGEEVIDKNRAARDVLKALHRNAMVAVLIDQNVQRSEAVFVDFFGQAAATTPAPAVFHIRTGSPLIPIFCYPGLGHNYQIKILPPLSIQLSGRFKEDMLKITQICTKMIEDQIRKNPNYWLWFHNRWKTRPEKESGLHPRAGGKIQEAKNQKGSKNSS